MSITICKYRSFPNLKLEHSLVWRGIIVSVKFGVKTKKAHYLETVGL